MKLNTTESQLTDRQKGLLMYWESLCQGGQLPVRRKLNPVQLGGALANTSLVEQVAGSFRFRLTGSRLEGLFGRKTQGRLIDELDASIAEAGSASMELALETGRPIMGHHKVGARFHCWLRVPMLDDEGQPRLVLCLDEFPCNLPAKAQGFSEEDFLEKSERIVA